MSINQGTLTTSRRILESSELEWSPLEIRLLKRSVKLYGANIVAISKLHRRSYESIVHEMLTLNILKIKEPVIEESDYLINEVLEVL